MYQMYSKFSKFSGTDKIRVSAFTLLRLGICRYWSDGYYDIYVLRRLIGVVENILREEQAGFRRGCSCSEQIFTLRNIIEQCIEYQRPLFINFIDYQKAFDSVHRESLWHIARSHGTPQQYVNIFKKLYLNSSCCVRTDNGTTNFFNIETGVRQGYILSPLLFLLTIDFVMKNAMNKPNISISWNQGTRVTDLDFADNVTLLAETDEQLQDMTTNLEAEAAKVGLRMSHSKTKVMRTGPIQSHINIQIGNTAIERVQQFHYLGSILSCENGGSEADVNCRVGKASAVFQKMRPI